MFVFAWAIGEGIIVYRWVKKGAPPTPGALLLPSGIFLALAVLAEYQPARAVATAFAYAVDLAVLVQVVGKEPAQVTGWPPPQNIPSTSVLPTGTAGSSSSSTAGSSSSSEPIQNPVSGGNLNPFQQIIGEPI
jgi:hypothetical protein